MSFEGLVIGICGDCASGAGAAAADLAQEAGEACPGAEVRVLERPCSPPSELQAALLALEGDALVLLACRDAEAVEALRRALAYPGADPDQIVLRLPGLDENVSRRGLLGLLRPQYRVVPRVDSGRCAAALGCRFCRGACPRRALAFDGGAAQVVPVRCSGCGACVPACRFGAIRFPTWTAEELSAELSGLLEAGATAGVMFACEPALAATTAAGEPPADGWESVALPCLGRLDARLILQAAAGGADVRVRACPGACPHGCRLDGVRRAVAFSRRVLAAAGRPRAVRWFPELPEEGGTLSLRRFLHRPRIPGRRRPGGTRPPRLRWPGWSRSSFPPLPAVPCPSRAASSPSGS